MLSGPPASPDARGPWPLDAPPGLGRGASVETDPPALPAADEAAAEPVANGAVAPRLTRGGALAEVLLCSDLPTQIFVMGILAAVGLMPLAGGRLSIGYIGTLLTLDAILLTGLILVLLRLHGERADTLFLGARPILREATLGLLLTPAVFLLAASIMALIRLAVPSLRTVPDNPLAELLNTRQNATIFALVAMIAGGLREELQRAFILHRFEQRLGGATVGIIVFSAAFGLGHLLQGADVAIATAVLGAFWGLIYLWRRSIVAPVVSHALFNLIQIASHRVLTSPQITQIDHPQITQVTQGWMTQVFW